MAKLHADPRRHWTVADLAAECAVSRSLLDDRFRKVLRRAPIRYLTEWRLHLAEILLADTTDSVAKIARTVGYDSDEGLEPVLQTCARSVAVGVAGGAALRFRVRDRPISVGPGSSGARRTDVLAN